MLKAAVKVFTWFLRAVYAFCSLFPHHKRVVFISRQGKNPPRDFKMMAQWFAENESSWEIKMLPDAMKNPLTYLPIMIRQTYFLATSDIVVLERWCLVVSLLEDRTKAAVVQVWHAMGSVKKFGLTALNVEEGHSTNAARALKMHEGYDGVAIASLGSSDHFAKSFGVAPEVLFEAPLPHSDKLLSASYRTKQRARFLEDHPEARGKSTVLYCPTFRNHPSEHDTRALEALITAFDFSRYNLVVKPHPRSPLKTDDSRVIFTKKSALETLCWADIVVTDYSTIMYEAGLIHLPVYLYAYDWEDYREKRDFSIDFEHEVPAFMTSNAGELMQAIESGTFNDEAFQAFVEENIRVPKEISCTENMCQHILAIYNKKASRTS